MDLWIRSQDKKRLIKIFDFKNDNCCIWGYSYTDTGALLGEYKTKERALEVLDEIQNIFSLHIENANYNEADLLLKAKMLPIIYEMPKEVDKYEC